MVIAAERREGQRLALDQLSNHGGLVALDVKIIVLLSPVRRKKTFSVTFRKGGGEDSEAAVLAGQSDRAVFVLDEDRP